MIVSDYDPFAFALHAMKLVAGRGLAYPLARNDRVKVKYIR